MRKIIFLIVMVVGLLPVGSSLAQTDYVPGPPTDLDASVYNADTLELGWVVHPPNKSPIIRQTVFFWVESSDVCNPDSPHKLQKFYNNADLIPPAPFPTGYVNALLGLAPNQPYCYEVTSTSFGGTSDFSETYGPIYVRLPVPDAGENIQITGASQTSTIIQGTGTEPDNDLLQYRWLEGADVLLDWTAVGVNGEAYLDLGTLPRMSLGDHTLTLEVTDATTTKADDMILTIDNSPPQVQPAPTSQTVEIGVDPITNVADVGDFDGDTVTYAWLLNGEVLASGNVDTIQGGETVQIPDLVIQAGDPMFTLGTHTIELTVSDSVNSPVSASVSVKVIDTIAPSLSPLPSITMLWPPNHTLQPVTVQANAYDNGGGPINLEVSVTSSEPPDMDGDGSTIPDYYIGSVSDETGLIELSLRSERSGTGEGRTYTITITATDESGNQSQADVEISAPHDKRKM